MELDIKDLKKISLMITILVLGVLTFLLVKPILISILTGLILAYILQPIYQRILPSVGSKNTATWIIMILIFLIVFVPIWFVVPLILKQVFDLFALSQEVNMVFLVERFIPTASQEVINDVTLTLNNFVGSFTTVLLETFSGFVSNLPVVSLHVVIILFVFFYALRDSEKLRDFVRGLSPFTKTKENLIVKHFKDITDSVVYGQIIIGVIQGALAGLGFLIFGVDNVLVLTIVAMFVSIFPIVGPYILWIPITIYLFASGSIGTAIGYLLYNLLIVSTLDNFLRTYFVARKTDISPAVIMVAMIGGLIVFGIMGLLLGPLIIAYLLMFLRSYKDKTLYNLIAEEK